MSIKKISAALLSLVLVAALCFPAPLAFASPLQEGGVEAGATEGSLNQETGAESGQDDNAASDGSQEDAKESDLEQSSDEGMGGSEEGSSDIADTEGEETPEGAADAVVPSTLADNFELFADSATEGVFIIKSSLGTVLDVAGASTASAANVQTYRNNNTPAQRFRITKTSDGYYSIINANSGKALDVAGASRKSGTNVWQYASNNSDAQKWKLVSTGDSDGSFYIVSKLAENLCLDIALGSAAAGANVQIYAKNNSKAQKFILNKISKTIDSGSYVITSLVGSGKVLDVSGASTASGANIQTYAKNGTVAQRFDVSYNESTGYYSIKNMNSGCSLDVAGASTSQGANIQQYASNGSAAQLWSIEVDGSGYRIRSACSGLVLDVAGASSANGANVQVWGANSTNAQKWTFEPVAGISIDEGLYIIKSSINTNRVLDVASGSTADGANVQLYTSNNSYAQKFEIKAADGGYYTITNYKSKKALDVYGAGKANGTNVVQYAANGSDAQLWKPVYYSGGFMFQSKCNGLFLDVYGANAVDGANIHVWSRNNTAAQRFVLSKTDTSTTITEGAYAISSVSDASKSIGMTGSSKANAAQAQLQASDSSFTQKFKILSAGDGSFYLINVHSSKYLDVDTGTKSKLQQWDRTAASNQKWKIVSTGEDDKTFCVQSVYTGQYLTNDNGVLRLAPSNGSVEQKFSFNHTAAFKVYLDAGHGANGTGTGAFDPGALGCGLREVDLTVDLVNRIASRLEAKGVEVYVNNYGGDYKGRHQEAINMGCSTFVSIHFNAVGGTLGGSESYIHVNAGSGAKALQDIMHPNLVVGTGLYDRGKRTNTFAVTSGRLPSTLLEVAFIDNWNDMGSYATRKDIVADRLAAGIETASKNSACGWY